MRPIRRSLAFALCLSALSATAQWTSVAPYGGHFTSGLSLHDTLLVGTPCGIYRTLDNGTTFLPHSKGMPAGDVISLLENSGRLFACLRDKGVYTSDDRGVTWQLSLRGRYLDQSTNVSGHIQMVNGNVFVRGYIADSLYFTANNGQSWTARHLGTLSYVNVDAAGGYLFCYGGAGQLGATMGLYRSGDLGQTWTPIPTMTAYVNHVMQVGGYLYAFGQHSYVSDDVGASFTQATTTASGFSAAKLAYDGTWFWLHQGGGSDLHVATWQPGQTSWQDALGNLPSAGNTQELFTHNGRVWVSRADETYSCSVPGTWTPCALAGVNGVVLHDLFGDGGGLLAGLDAGYDQATDANNQWTLNSPSTLFDGVWNMVRSGPDMLVGMGYAGSGVTTLAYTTNSGSDWHVTAHVADLRIGYGHFALFNDTVLAYGPSASYDTPTFDLYDLQGNEITDLSLGLFGATSDDRVTSAVRAPDGFYALVAGEYDTTALLFRWALPNGINWEVVLPHQVSDPPTKATAIGARGERLFLGLAGGNGVQVSDDGGDSWSLLNNGLDHVTPQTFTTAEGMVFMTSDKGVYFLPPAGDTWIDISNDLLVGTIDQVQLGANNVWVRARNGGVWKLPRYGNVGIAAITTTDPAMQLWPNPAVDRVHLSVEAGTTGTVDILDARGAMVRQEVLPSRSGTLDVDVSALPAGVYTCLLRTAQGVRAGRFVCLGR